MNNKFLIGLVVAAIIAAVVLGYIYLKPAKEGALDTTKTASESVPNISTNPADDVPEVNPLDRANPFKYTNPLR